MEKATELFMAGYNCSQAVYCALSDLYGMPDKMAMQVSASMGGGIGRMRLTCGCACAMFLLAGFEEGQTEPHDNEQKSKNYAVVQELARRFEAEHGSIVCSELLEMRKVKPDTTPAPDARTAEYYKVRPCLRQVQSAVRIYCGWLSEREN